MESSPLYKENELLILITKGDENAFATVFNHYQGKLFAVGLDLTRSEEVAEELVQDVFLKVWLKRSDLLQIESFPDYLFIIMRNESYDWLSKQARRRKILEQISANNPGEESIRDEFLERKEFADLIRKGVQQLPAKQQEVFRLMRQEGLSREQTAHALQIDQNTVKTHMSRALRTLRAWCVAHGELCIIAWLIGQRNFL